MRPKLLVATMNKIVVASSNAGKLADIKLLLDDLPIEFIPQAEFCIDDADETGLTFVENAIIKARHACVKTALPSIADDSGLLVAALDGAPGVYSARYADGGTAANIEKLLQQLAGIPEAQRDARFHCSIVLLKNATDPAPIIVEANWEGRILLTPRGDYGFGYDPIFFVPTHQCSAAELTAAEKIKLSHRGQALRLLHDNM